MAFGKDMLDMLPYRDAEVCDYVRSIAKQHITRREPHHHQQFEIQVIEQEADLYERLADDIHNRIIAAAGEDRPFVAVLPVGPTAQYPMLAEKINENGTDLGHVHLFFMDEYAYPDGSIIEKDSPWSFENTANQKLFSAIDENLRPPDDQVHFPGTENIDRYDDMIAEASGGVGAEVVYGGIGWSGHFAFWDPHLWEEFGGEEAIWRQARASFVQLHPMTVLHNSLRAGGDWSSIPPCAYTIGPNIFLSATYRSFWCNAYLGRGMSWQRFIGRLCTHGEVTPKVPASYIQTLPGRVTFLGAVAEDIGGPKTSWQ
ncbi:MAG: 6-phosphogluconolactonase [Armatimonadota bacterium]